MIIFPSVCSDQEGGDLSVSKQHHANHGGVDLGVAADGPRQPDGPALRQPAVLSFHRLEQGRCQRSVR